jgi:hypothetical protein
MFAGSLHADLGRAKAEPSLEKRSAIAMDNALSVFQSAREAYRKGDDKQVAAAAAEVEESVNLAFTSLQQTGKDPRKYPKYFKRAEIGTRELLRRLEAFQGEMDFADRAMLNELRGRVQQVHDELLVGLMEGKHK